MKNFKQNLIIKCLVFMALFTAFAAKSQCNASFNYTVGSNGSVQFASTSTGTNAGTSSYWYFGDGGSGWGTSTNHTYTSNGGFYATLMISDSISSCWDSASVYINITNVTNPTNTCSLTASFNYTVGSNGNVQFANTSTGAGINANYYWYFGDGNVGSGTTTSNQYASAGNYLAVLYVSDSLTNCTDTFGLWINVNTAPCVANVNFGLYQDSVQALTWNAYPNYPANIVSATWSWGDGSNSSGLYPSHTYSAAGMYSICVTISVSCGATGSSCSYSNIYRTSSAQLSSAITVNVKNAGGPTGIKTNNALFEDISLYPNPTSENISLNLQGEANQSLSVNVFNTNGQLVLNQLETLQNGNNKVALNTVDLAPGIYLIKLNSGNKQQTIKMVKQ